MTTLEIHGVAVPRIGLGTWRLSGRECAEAVRHALELGYRHVDTARVYGNEKDVGRGLADSPVPREHVFVTSKVWTDDLHPDDVRRSAEASLRALALEQLDLLLIHWPSPDVPLEATLAAMTNLFDQGLIRLLGVSNFPPGLFRQALELAPVATNQVEFHPYLAQDALVDLAAAHESSVTAYAPVARGKVVRDPILQDVARRHGRSAAQVSLRWLLDHPRTIVVPKAATPQRRAENLDLWDFELTDAERERIAALPKDERDVDPAWAPDWRA